MDHKYNGKAIIFKNEIFQFRDDSPTAEIRIDCSNLEASLKKLGFDVTTYVDLTLIELIKTIEKCMYHIVY